MASKQGTAPGTINVDDAINRVFMSLITYAGDTMGLRHLFTTEMTMFLDNVKDNRSALFVYLCALDDGTDELRNTLETGTWDMVEEDLKARELHMLAGLVRRSRTELADSTHNAQVRRRLICLCDLFRALRPTQK